MPISPERLSEFMRIYQAEFDESISEAEAREMTARLIELYSILAEQLPIEVREQLIQDEGHLSSLDH